MSTVRALVPPAGVDDVDLVLDGVDLVLDTNVLMDLHAADLLRAFDNESSARDARVSRDVRCRQLKARYSSLLVWICSQRRLTTLSLEDEFTRKLEEIIPPGSGTMSEALTKVFVYVVSNGMLRGWKGRAVKDDSYSPTGDSADDWYLKLARSAGVPVITHEGVTSSGYRRTNNRGKLNLRGKCETAGVPVFSSYEYLKHLGVDCGHEAVLFVNAYAKAAPEALATSKITGASAREMALKLQDYYRFVLLDEVDAVVEGIEPPTIDWHR